MLWDYSKSFSANFNSYFSDEKTKFNFGFAKKNKKVELAKEVEGRDYLSRILESFPSTKMHELGCFAQESIQVKNEQAKKFKGFIFDYLFAEISIFMAKKIFVMNENMLLKKDIFVLYSKNEKLLLHNVAYHKEKYACANYYLQYENLNYYGFKKQLNFYFSTGIENRLFVTEKEMTKDGSGSDEVILLNPLFSNPKYLSGLEGLYKNIENSFPHYVKKDDLVNKLKFFDEKTIMEKGWNFKKPYGYKISVENQEVKLSDKQMNHCEKLFFDENALFKFTKKLESIRQRKIREHKAGVAKPKLTKETLERMNELAPGNAYKKRANDINMYEIKNNLATVMKSILDDFLGGDKHILGALGSGKSTLQSALMFSYAEAGYNTVFVVRNKDEAESIHKKAAELKKEAVYFTGRSNRASQLNEMLKGTLSKGGNLFEELENTTKLSFLQNFENTCLMDYLDGNYSKLKKQKEIGKNFSYSFDCTINDGGCKVCPFFQECSSNQVEHRMTESNIWIFNVDSWAKSKTHTLFDKYRRTLFETAIIWGDLFVIDEIDGIQKRLDEIFLLQNLIYSPKEDESLLNQSVINSIRHLGDITREEILQLSLEVASNTSSLLFDFFNDLDFAQKLTERNLLGFTLVSEWLNKYTDIREQSQYADEESYQKIVRTLSSLFRMENALTLKKRVNPGNLNWMKGSHGIKAPEIIERTYGALEDGQFHYYSLRKTLRELREKEMKENFEETFDSSKSFVGEKRMKLLDAEINKILNFFQLDFNEKSLQNYNKIYLEFEFALFFNAVQSAINQLQFRLQGLGLEYWNEKNDEKQNPDAINQNILGTPKKLTNDHYKHLSIPLLSSTQSFLIQKEKHEVIHENNPVTIVQNTFAGIGRNLITESLRRISFANQIQPPNTVLLSATSNVQESSKYFVDIEPELLITNKTQEKQRTKFYHSNSLGIDLSGAVVNFSPYEFEQRSKAVVEDMLLPRGLISTLLKKNQWEFEQKDKKIKDLRDKLKKEDDEDLKSETLRKIQSLYSEKQTVICIVTSSYKKVDIITKCLSEKLMENGLSEVKIAKLHKSNNYEDKKDQKNVVKIEANDVENLHTKEVQIFVCIQSVLERGYNILKGEKSTKSLISDVLFWNRPHVVPNTLEEKMFTLNNFQRYLRLEFQDNGMSLGAALEEASRRTTQLFDKLLSSLDSWKALNDDERMVQAANHFVSISQFIGRGLRGGTNVNVFFIDAKFAEETAAAIRNNEYVTHLVDTKSETSMLIAFMIVFLNAKLDKATGKMKVNMKTFKQQNFVEYETLKPILIGLSEIKVFQLSDDEQDLYQ